MRLYPETQAIWRTLQLVLSLFNDTFRQNPKPTIWNLTPSCNLLAMLFFSFEKTEHQFESEFPVWAPASYL